MTKTMFGNGFTGVALFAFFLVSTGLHHAQGQAPTGPLAIINPGYASTPASGSEHPGSILKGMCWGPCKENAYLALLASDPNLTRDQVGKMSEADLGAHSVGAMPSNQPFVELNPQWLISAATLKPLMQNASRPFLVDSRSGPDDDGRRILGAFCIPLPLASEAVKTYLPDIKALVVVYGNDEKSMSVIGVAAELRRRGYAHVLELREGLAGWQAAGGEIIIPEGYRSPPTASEATLQ